MGLFGKLFEKKQCSVCGGEIGLLGNRKLEDGNLCKTCAKKLSPWFSERRHSTVEEINRQLAYREENRKKAAQFGTTRSIGEDWKLLTDETHRWVTVTKSGNLAETNPDILDYGDITGCRTDIDETQTELKHDDKNGNKVSYNPPRYEYTYNFDIILSVNNPYFDEMRFRLNPLSVKVTQSVPTASGSNLGRLLNNLSNNSFSPTNDPKYRQYQQMAEEICEEVRRIQDADRNASATEAQVQPQAATAAAQPQTWVCPACGSTNSSKFCESCGSPRP